MGTIPGGTRTWSTETDVNSLHAFFVDLRAIFGGTILLNQAVWYLKCRALTLEQYLDDTEMEEQVRAYLLVWNTRTPQRTACLTETPLPFQTPNIVRRTRSQIPH